MTFKNLTMTFELGLISTWRFPAFSALFMLFSASLRTEVLTIFAVEVRNGIDGRMRFSSQGHRDLRYLHDHCELVFKASSAKSAQLRVL